MMFMLHIKFYEILLDSFRGVAMKADIILCYRWMDRHGALTPRPASAFGNAVKNNEKCIKVNHLTALVNYVGY